MSEEPRPPLDVEEVRRRLRERGYLEGRIERFLLRDLLAGGPAAGRLLRPVLRAALLGGPVLGLLLAAAAAAGNRPHLGPGDLLVLWLWCALLAGAGLFGLNLAAALAAAAPARRRGARPGDAPRAALLVGLPTLAYLALLLGTGHAGTGPAGDLLFLAAAVAVTLLVAWLGGMVSLAGIVGRTGQVPDRRRRPALLLLLVLVPALAAAAAVRWTGAAGERAAGPSPFLPARGAPRLLLLAVDGLDGDLVEALAETGAVDGLLAGMRAGAVFPVTRPAGLEPPEVWTTYLTGMPAEAHGVRSVGAERLPGVSAPLSGGAGPLPVRAALRHLLPTRTTPLTGAGRRVRALWEIVALKERSAAVGFWATWPAGIPGEDAYVVSDRVLAKLLAGAPEDRDTAPASLFARLRADFDADRARLRALFEARMAPAAAGDGEAARVAWESLLIDGHALAAADRLREDPAVRAAFAYLPGLDLLRRRLVSRPGADSVAGLLSTQRTLEAYVRWLDGALAFRLRPADGEQAVLLADPGRGATPRSEGFLVAVGGAVEPGCVSRSPLGPLDVAPVVLGLLGYPASEEMAGRLPAACLLPPAVETGRVDTFGRRDVPDEDPVSASDPQMIERLKSLGYLR